MASHTHLDSPSTKSKQPYKVAGLRFNPKFISSISKSLSRGPEREREADEDDDAFPSLRRPFRFLPVFPPLSPPLSFSLFPPPPTPPPPARPPDPTLFRSPISRDHRNVRWLHRCILSIPLHYDSYIAIFIISAIHRCWRDRGLTSCSLFSRTLYSSFSISPDSLYLCPLLSSPPRPLKGPRSRRVVPRFVHWTTLRDVERGNKSTRCGPRLFPTEIPSPLFFPRAVGTVRSVGTVGGGGVRGRMSRVGG